MVANDYPSAHTDTGVTVTWAFLALLFLLGCSPTLVWDRMGRSDEQFAGDKNECQSDTRVAVNGRFQPPPHPPPAEYRTADGLFIPQANPWSASADLRPVFQQYVFERQFFQACMEARGYRIVESVGENKRY